MNFTKEFIQKQSGEIVIKDMNKSNEFIREKVKYFTDINKFACKNEILNLYQEIIDMCDFDIKTAKMDTSISDQLIGFNRLSVFEPVILMFNFSSILGEIYKKLFLLESHRLHLKTSGCNGPVSKLKN